MKKSLLHLLERYEHDSEAFERAAHRFALKVPGIWLVLPWPVLLGEYVEWFTCKCLQYRDTVIAAEKPLAYLRRMRRNCYSDITKGIFAIVSVRFKKRAPYRALLAELEKQGAKIYKKSKRVQGKLVVEVKTTISCAKKLPNDPRIEHVEVISIVPATVSLDEAKETAGFDIPTEDKKLAMFRSVHNLNVATESIEHLDPLGAKILLLRLPDVDGKNLTFEEVAEEVDRTVSTVKIRLRRFLPLLANAVTDIKDDLLKLWSVIWKE